MQNLFDVDKVFSWQGMDSRKLYGKDISARTRQQLTILQLNLLKKHIWRVGNALRQTQSENNLALVKIL